jgi:hypothetical protein
MLDPAAGQGETAIRAPDLGRRNQQAGVIGALEQQLQPPDHIRWRPVRLAAVAGWDQLEAGAYAPGGGQPGASPLVERLRQLGQLGRVGVDHRGWPR